MLLHSKIRPLIRLLFLPWSCIRKCWVTVTGGKLFSNADKLDCDIWTCIDYGINLKYKLAGRAGKDTGGFWYHQLLWTGDKKISSLPCSHWWSPVHVQQVSSKSGAHACVYCPRQQNLWLSPTMWPLTSVKRGQREAGHLTAIWASPWSREWWSSLDWSKL